jgi:hypothetical protein
VQTAPSDDPDVVLVAGLTFDPPLVVDADKLRGLAVHAPDGEVLIYKVKQ